MYEYLWYFLIYSFGGWIAEVMFQAVTKAKVVNRGFLLGPVCPIYGFGMMFILKVYGMFECGLLGSFVIGIVLATLIELIGGYVLYKLFSARWWDYSDRKFQFHGFICLEFSLIWGFAATFIVKLVHPAVAHTVALICARGIMALTVTCILCLVYVSDVIYTFVIVNKFNKDLASLSGLAESIRTVSDNLSQIIGENTIKGAGYLDEQRLQAALYKAEVRDDMSEKYNEAVLKMQQLKRKMTKQHFLGEYRLMKAFPGMIHDKYKEALKAVMDNILNGEK